MCVSSQSWGLPDCSTSPPFNNCYGSFTWADGGKYVGEWKDNKRNGQGTFTWGAKSKWAGDKYVGEHKNGLPNGQGTFTWANGDKYVGEFKDNKRTGEGILFFANGDVEEGIFKNNKFMYAQKIKKTEKKQEIEKMIIITKETKDRIIRQLKSNKTVGDPRILFKGRPNTFYSIPAKCMNCPVTSKNIKTKSKFRASPEKKAERKRIAKEKKIAEKKKILKEKRIAKEKRVAKEKRIEREKQSKSNPGFRDLRPGIHRSTITKMKICKSLLNFRKGTSCYDLDNLKFLGRYNSDGHLQKLTIDLGPIVGSMGTLASLAAYIQHGDETNIYLKMRNNLDKKYKLDFTFSERERQLFNKNQKKELYSVYNNGQVALSIKRKEKDNSYFVDLWLYVEYRDKKSAQVFFKSKKPVRTKKSDF